MHEEELRTDFQDPPKAYPLHNQMVGEKKSKVMVKNKKKMDEEKEQCVRCGNKFRDQHDLGKHIK